MKALSPLRYRTPLTLLFAIAIISACGGHVNYIVKPGDTLYSVGWKYGEDYRKIAEWNKLNPPYALREGQTLRMAPPVRPWWADEYPPERFKSYQQEAGQAAVTSSQSVSSTRTRKQIPRPKLAPPMTTTPVARWHWPTIASLQAKYVNDPQHKKGVVFAGKRGEPVYAVAKGQVVYSGSGLIGYGRLIIIKHNKTYLSAYAHNDEILVGEGDQVSVGQQIAKMGSTGIDEVLLYFEIRQNGVPVDPLKFVSNAER